MKSIEELTRHFGKYLSNTNFENFRNEILIKPTKYTNDFIKCKISKIELCFTNERMLRESDSEKSLVGGKPIFTNFFIYPETEKYFKKLPFNVTFNDSLDEIISKCGKPTEIKEINNFLFGDVTKMLYEIGKLKIIYTFDKKTNQINQISFEQFPKEIVE